MNKVLKTLFSLFLVLFLWINFSYWGNTSSFQDFTKESNQSANNLNISFQNDLFSWWANYSVDFSFPEGQRWLTPGLNLRYNSSTADFLNNAGYGFSIENQQIFRSTRKWLENLYKLNEFSINSNFSNGELIETTNWKYIAKQWNDINIYNFNSETDSWTIKDRSWKTYYFWTNNNYKIINPENNKTFSYLLAKIEDNFWYKIEYSYNKKDNRAYLKEIKYWFNISNTLENPLYKITLNYTERDFSMESYIHWFKEKNHRLLQSVNLNVLENSSYNNFKTYEIKYSDIETPFPKINSVITKSWSDILEILKFKYHASWAWLNLLSEIDNWKWWVTKMEYKSSALYKKTTVPFIIKTLYKVTTIDSITWVTTQKIYDYFWWHYYFDASNFYNRWYTGFSKVNIIDDYNNITSVYFHQSDKDKNNSEDSKLWEFEDHISKKWRIYRQETVNQKWERLKTSITKWIKKDRWNWAYFVFPENEVNIEYNEKTWEHKDTANYKQYDSYWNLTKEINYWFVNADTNSWNFTDILDDKITKTIKYATDIDSKNNIFVNNPCEQTLVDNNRKLVNSEIYFYDNLNKCEIKKWLLTEKQRFFEDENRYLRESYGYTSWVLTSSTNAKRFTSTFKYNKYNLLKTSETNPKNWSVKYSYNYAFQKPTKITDINWITRQISYDNFGRPTKVEIINPTSEAEWQTLEKILLEKYNYNTNVKPNYSEKISYSWENNNNNITSRVYVDWFWKTIQIKVSSKENNKYSSVKTRYNKLDKKEFVTYPKYETWINYSPIWETEKWNYFKYDWLWRLIKQKNETWIILHDYLPYKDILINQKWIKKELEYNAYWSLKKVIEYNSGEQYTTNYKYNSLQKLIKQIDSKNNIRNLYYDSLGRIKKMEDLHSNSEANPKFIAFKYDDNNNIVLKTLLNWQAIRYDYDNLDRVTQKITEEWKALYNYDIWNYSKWKLSNTSYLWYKEIYNYNYFGQIIQNRKIYKDWNSYDINYNFTPRWELKTITYPDNTNSSYSYVNGYINKIKYNNSDLVTRVKYNDDYQISEIEYANWTIEKKDFDYNYWYRLKAKTAYNWDNIYQDLVYNFDNIWNIINLEEKADSVLKKKVNYNYDDLNRLIKAVYNTDSTEEINYTYDSIWNMLSNSRIWNYEYNSWFNPHAVNKAWDTTFEYDWLWNVNKEIFWENIKNYIYNSASDLTNFSFNNNGNKITWEYIYDHANNRVQKNTFVWEDYTENKYIWDNYELESWYYFVEVTESIFNNETQTQETVTRKIKKPYTKKRKFILALDKKIATIEKENEEAEKTIFNISDHLSWASIDIDDTWKILQAVDYYPFGEQRVMFRDNTYSNDYLFTGKEQDEESWLQYFEVRYYSPHIWRFYWQDAVFWEVWNTKRWIRLLSDPQQLNAYSYVANNPLIYVDPSGMVLEEVWEWVKMVWTWLLELWKIWLDFLLDTKCVWEWCSWDFDYTWNIISEIEENSSWLAWLILVLKTIKDAKNFDVKDLRKDFKRIQHAFSKHWKELWFSWNLKEDWKEFIGMLENVLTDYSKVKKWKVWRDGETFDRYYKKVDWKDVWVDIYTSWKNAWKLKTTVNLTKEQVKDLDN
jgi:RHS repeat-associated protein